MLKGYSHMVDFFTSFEWWKTDPHDELVDKGAYCLAKPGEIYAVYLPKDGKVTVKSGAGDVPSGLVQRVHRRVGGAAGGRGTHWTSPQTPGWLDWALLLERQH